MSDATLTLFKAERDTLAGLGLLTHNYQHFDPALTLHGRIIHSFGYNVHCLVVDNVDGEVIGVGQNRIHGEDNPLQHAEQVGVRAAMDRLHVKRPRAIGQSVDEYFRKSFFMGPGIEPEDFVNTGCTLYNTFDPCGFCATTLLVCFMKRIAYLFEDDKFAGVYKYMGETYFTHRESVKESLTLATEGSATIRTGAQIIARLQQKVNALVKQVPAVPNQQASPKVELVTSLDSCFAELEEAAQCLASVRDSDLSTSGADFSRNLQTLNDLRTILRLS